MIGHDDIERVIGAKLHGEGDTSLGRIETVYVDDQTDQPTFALVRTGLLGRHDSFVPLRDATVDDDGVHVPYTKDRVTGAPHLDDDGDHRLTPGDEAELFLYYGLPYSQEYGDTRHDDPAAAPRPGDDPRPRLRRHPT